jgi:biopolymer transport protein ExbB
MPVYGIAHLWVQGDAMTRGVASLLVAMSVVSWSVIVYKAIGLASIRRRVGPAHAWAIEGIDSMNVALRALGPPGTPLRDLAQAGRSALAQHAARAARLDADQWLQRSLSASVSHSAMQMQRGLGLLASIGSTAPFVGLLGTVWGIYHALLSLGATGDASLERVAGPVGEALIMTAFGLCVAIPAVLGYQMLARLSRDVTLHLERHAHGLHALLLMDDDRAQAHAAEVTA